MNVALTGATGFIGSHILTELAEVCTHVGIIERGRLLVSGAVDEILRRMQPARTAGYSHTRIVFRHMAPNVAAPYLIVLTGFVAQAILAEASLSFLGVQEATPAWA